MVSAWWNSCSF